MVRHSTSIRAPFCWLMLPAELLILDRFFWTDTFSTGEAFRKTLNAAYAELRFAFTELGVVKARP